MGSDESTRRRFLRASGVAGAVGLAGCTPITGGDGGTTTGVGGDGTGTGTRTGDGWTDASFEATAWETVTGDWEFSDGVARQTENVSDSKDDTDRIALLRDVTLGDGVVSAEVNSVDGENGQALVFRQHTESEQLRYYTFGTGDIDGGNVSINANTIPVESERDQEWYGADNVEKTSLSEHDLELDADTFYEYEVRFEDDRIEGYIDGELLLDIEDDTYESTGRIGFHCGSLTEYRSLRYRTL